MSDLRVKYTVDSDTTNPIMIPIVLISSTTGVDSPSFGEWEI